MPMFVEGTGFYTNWLAFVTPMIVTVKITPTVKGGHFEKLARSGATLVLTCLCLPSCWFPACCWILACRWYEPTSD